MAAIDNRKKLRASILDRLFDDEPHNINDHDIGHHQFINQLKKTIRRDLENLLNTRFFITKPADIYTEIDTSLLNYGLPDLATVNIIDIDKRNEFTRKLEQTLREYEPRFKSVKVSYLDNTDSTDRTLRFRIDGTIYADPSPEVVVFDSVLEAATRNVSVKEVGHGR